MQTQPKSRLYREYYRNGASHRSGADVSFQDVLRLFKFKSIHIGKWVSKEEQQIAANLFFDALCDLMDILQVPENVISLNSTLSLAFGVGGQKHASAHYNSATRQLALAKNAGGGALAHEWFHAFDHYISQKMFKVSGPNMFASEIWLVGKSSPHPHPLNSRLAACFEAMFLDGASGSSTPPKDSKIETSQLANTGIHNSLLMQKSIHADALLKMFYYARPQEVAARSFEAFVQDHQIKNAFLVQGTKQSPEAKMGIYPQGTQKNAINHALADYFMTLGWALEQH